MLRKLNGKDDFSGAYVKISNADFPNPFKSQLEYNAPSRGAWNIVHTGMLVPESHQIFVCAEGCLRGVVLTAAEMNAMDRMSWVAITETDIYDGSMEQKVIDGTTDILERMKKKPKVVLLFLSCIQFFAGCDFELIINELSNKFPYIKFVDSYMTPTMQKSGMNPDMLTRKGLYAPLEKTIRDKMAVNIIGNDRATDEDSELVKIIKGNGFTLRDITLCKSYEEYLKMAEGNLNISYIPTATLAVKDLEVRLSQKSIYIPLSYSYTKIGENYQRLCNVLKIDCPDFSKDIEKAEKALENAKKKICNVAISVDYTATPRPLGFSRLLLEHGFNVKRIYSDCLSAEEKQDFDWIKKNFPNVEIGATVQVKMRFAGHSKDNCNEKYLAIGQKACYFCGTDNFVNIVSGGGFYGFKGIEKLCGLMIDAFENPKDRREVIQIKGLGCESCL